MEAPRHRGTHRALAAEDKTTRLQLFKIPLMIESNYTRSQYPRLCNMEFADAKQFSFAAKELLGAQLNIAMN